MAITTNRIFQLFCLTLSCVWGMACSTPEVSTDDQLLALGEIDYNFHVKPILSENCYLCHGPDLSSRKGKLRLDLPDSAYAVRKDGGFAIVVGDPEQSLLYKRVSSSDPKKVMPPPETHSELSDLEVGILRKWIEQGAEYKKHWAFIAPEKSELPLLTQPVWGSNEIDSFVLASMTAKGFEPSESANKRSLLRRLSYDLTGLPPSVEDLLAFEADNEAGAYERQVDRLLASNHFGERMAVSWLDQARYSDTNGYSIDGGRHLWLWRDWVIQAYNDNMPFDQFVVEQLAGDLLPDATEAQLVATGFNRNNMNTHEGGTIPEENLNNYVVDRVKTTGEVFMGLTLGCAQCHDHKYDPISQREYYQFYAYFNTIAEKSNDGDRGINSIPIIEASPILKNDDEIADIKEALEVLTQEQDRMNSDLTAWETELENHLAKKGQDFELHELKATKIFTPNSGNSGRVLDDSSILIDNPAYLAPYNVTLEVDPKLIQKPITGLRIEFYPNEISKGRIGHGREEGLKDTFVLTALTISAGTVPSDQVDLYGIKHFKQVTATTSHPDYPPANVQDERRINGWSPHPNNRTKQSITATFIEPLDPGQTPHLTAMAIFGQGNYAVPGHFKIFATTGIDDGSFIPDNIQSILAISAVSRTESQKGEMKEFFLAQSPMTSSIRHKEENLRERLSVLTDSHSTMVMAEAEDPRGAFILNRGQYDQPLDEVFPGTLAALPALPDSAEANRLGLAKWLVSENNPLTSRVAVNRIWQILFGKGLVGSSADFGSQGKLPSHPELLDWLSVTFMDDGWDVKKTIKRIVTSETYKQSSAASPDMLERDPQNQWLARGPRFRLQAEFIRDSALKMSGLLIDRIGGPSVNPYQPPGLWKEVSHYGSTGATSQVFVQDHGEKLYRRSLYTYWKRTSPPPSMASFDAPSREVCTVDRAVTNTPLQALVMLNDPQFVEASRFLAERIMIEGGDNAGEKINYAFQIVTGREPNNEEFKRLLDRYEEELNTYKENPDDALRYLSVGEAMRSEALDPIDQAAWTSVASLLLNLSETITRA